jgi:hypothetical protein
MHGIRDGLDTVLLAKGANALSRTACSWIYKVSEMTDALLQKSIVQFVR